MPLLRHHASYYYYNKWNEQGASLIRARRRYLVYNALTGITIFAFACSVYAYTIYAVKQDDFSDVVPPPIQEAKQTPAQSDSTLKKFSKGDDSLNARRDAALEGGSSTKWWNWRPSW